MKKTTTAFFILSTLLATPLLALAAPSNFRELTEIFTRLVNPIIGVLVSLAMLFFVWGIVKYIYHAGDEKKASEAKNVMTYGVFALFVLFSFWGIVSFFIESIFG